MWEEGGWEGSSRDLAAKGPWMLVCGKKGDGRASQGTWLLRARGCWCVGRGGMEGLYLCVCVVQR